MGGPGGTLYLLGEESSLLKLPATKNEKPDSEKEKSQKNVGSVLRMSRDFPHFFSPFHDLSLQT
jgi:hypothetical protein